MTIDDAALVSCLRRHVPGLRTAFLFGSCLSPTLRRPTSIPDVFALVDDREEALAALGLAPLARHLARRLPPATLALAARGGSLPSPKRAEPARLLRCSSVEYAEYSPSSRLAAGPAAPISARSDFHHGLLGATGAAGDVVAKINVATPAAVAEALARLPDLTLAGRLAKKTRLLVHRDAEAHAELCTLLDGAADAMARAATLGLPRRLSLAAASRRCFALSYRAEVRPERPAHIEARYAAFAGEYQARYQPRLAAAAQARGIEVIAGALVDRRPARLRREEARELASLLWRGRLRSMVRWSREPLLYRGWLPYLVAKLRRAWA